MSLAEAIILNVDFYVLMNKLDNSKYWTQKVAPTACRTSIPKAIEKVLQIPMRKLLPFGFRRWITEPSENQI